MRVCIKTITTLSERIVSSRSVFKGMSEKIKVITENIVTQISSPQAS